ncbi:peptide/nickel transport system ATP-binding protein [Gemmobacter aquatilis]|uniref:Peptide/nickel transport system ATP-binding protein n=1 Tax=Gemmobacter aquatilis TaxID=933059 RepID=A0A1H8JXP0_9RHOB|nr:ABC transporter ATP-binding protein [Gemmobacter aquatilis]SEN85489.1 peptide/nickel transport system ATP-binding protein [Gemmobacter aquatilis]
MSALLELSEVSVSIGRAALLERISLRLEPGHILGLVGESGSGKSLTAMAAMGLLPLIGGRVTGGTVRFDGQDIAAMTDGQRRALRGRRIGFVTQNPMTALDPVQRIGAQIDVVSRLHLGLSRQAARARTLDLLTQLRIPEAAAVAEAWPHQLSGGMKQRIVIAMALAGDPDLIVADEPTTALDVTVQAQIIQILGALVRERGLALLLITHDMGVVAQICDRVAVLYAGRLAEENAVDPIFAAPAHPYTRALIGCIPQEGMARGSLHGIPGAVPGALQFPPGCRFHPRCPQASALCRATVPPLTPHGAGIAACHHLSVEAR